MDRDECAKIRGDGCCGAESTSGESVSSDRVCSANAADGWTLRRRHCSCPHLYLNLKKRSTKENESFARNGPVYRKGSCSGWR